jgi:transcriptional regulator GlxA family with amidase domain
MRDAATVAVLMFDRTPMFETSVPISVFGVDRTVSGAPRFDLLPVAAEEGALTSTGGLRLHAPYGLAALDRAVSSSRRAGAIRMRPRRRPCSPPSVPRTPTARWS